MISPEIRAQIRRYFYAEHWKIGTIARELGVHPETVRNAIEAQHPNGTQVFRPSIVDPYAEFIRQILEQHPRLLATRIFQMARDRGYTGSVVQLRRAVARLRPKYREPFLRLETFPGEHYGEFCVMVTGDEGPRYCRESPVPARHGRHIMCYRDSSHSMRLDDSWGAGGSVA
jgi:transposase